MLVSAPILTYPVADGKFILDTDASDTWLGGVLSQVQIGKKKLLPMQVFFLLNLIKENTVHPIKNLYFLKHFRNYFCGQILPRRDHASFKSLKNFTNLEGIDCWLDKHCRYV